MVARSVYITSVFIDINNDPLNWAYEVLYGDRIQE